MQTIFVPYLYAYFVGSCHHFFLFLRFISIYAAQISEMLYICAAVVVRFCSFEVTIRIFHMAKNSQYRYYV